MKFPQPGHKLFSAAYNHQKQDYNNFGNRFDIRFEYQSAENFSAFCPYHRPCSYSSGYVLFIPMAGQEDREVKYG
jgi:hypothetical protein